MVLPIQKMKFDAFLAKPDGEPQLEAIPEMLPSINDPAGRIQFLSLSESHNYFSYIQPQRAIPVGDGNWAYQSNIKEVAMPLGNSDYLEGNLYEESAEGIYYKKNQEEAVLISNATIRIYGIIENWQSEEICEEKLVCEIRCNVWNGNEKYIEVPKEQYKQVYRLIHKKYPEISLATIGTDAMEEYLTSVFQHKPKILETEIRAAMTGWATIRGETRYRIGSDSFYNSVKLPEIKDQNILPIFYEGLSFLSIGRNNAAIATILLVAHIGYSLFWMRKGGMDFRSVLFIKGGSNLLKTSVIKEVANVFDMNRDHATVRVASTLASLQYNVCMLRDGVICVDDFSNSETKSKNKAVEAAEDIIRAVGDAIFCGKMSLKNNRNVERNTVRSAVILTGEEELGLGLSSNLRTVVISVGKDTFNGEALTNFQENRDIMRRYFALYLQFLTENGEKLSKNCRKAFVQYRTYYAAKLTVPRFIDAAAGLRVQTDFFRYFADWCGVAENEKTTLTQLFEDSILEIMQQNQKKSAEKRPEIRFLYAIMQSIGSTLNSGVADDEDVYCKDEAKYIGFYDTKSDLIWLRMEEAWSTVKTYYRNQGEDWLVKQQTIKDILLKAGISRGRQAGDDQAGNEYLCRARKGSRKRMLVLHQSIVEKLLKTEEGNL